MGKAQLGYHGYRYKLCKLNSEGIKYIIEKVEEGKTAIEIARDYGVSASTIRSWLRPYNIKFKKKKVTKENNNQKTGEVNLIQVGT